MVLLTRLILLLACVVGPVWIAHAGEVFPEGAQLEKLWNEGSFTEGVAVDFNGAVFFSDITAGEAPGRVLRFDPQTKETTVYCANSGQSNGLMFDRTGRLLAACGANHGRRSLAEIRPNGSVDDLVTKFNGKNFNSPNDLVIHPQGWVYFSDPRYVGDEPIELDLMNVFRFDSATGKVTRATAEISKPNGLIISPDGKTLYAAETNNGSNFGKRAGEVRMALHALPIREDGTLGAPSLIAKFTERGGIDGMTVDSQGRIYGAYRDTERFGILVLSPEGKEIDFLPTPELPTNCCFGRDKELGTLYMTVGTGLYRISTSASGYHSIKTEK